MMAYPTEDSASASIVAQNTFTLPVVMDYEGLDVSVSGLAQVLWKNSTAATRGNVAISDAVDGRASDIANFGGGLPGADTHFQEIGHVLETKSGGTNVLVFCNLHFN